VAWTTALKVWRPGDGAKALPHHTQSSMTRFAASSPLMSST